MATRKQAAARSASSCEVARSTSKGLWRGMIYTPGKEAVSKAKMIERVLEACRVI